jgi:NAD(P)H-dependent FMN reductase
MTDIGRGPLRFLVFSAALREQSLNSHLARLAAQTIEEHGGTVDLAAMAEFDAPSYDQDEQDGVGFPPGAEEFRRGLAASDAFVISSPEYNAAMPGLLKNAIDWVSRFRPQPPEPDHLLQVLAGHRS